MHGGGRNSRPHAAGVATCRAHYLGNPGSLQVIFVSLNNLDDWRKNPHEEATYIMRGRVTLRIMDRLEATDTTACQINGVKQGQLPSNWGRKGSQRM